MNTRAPTPRLIHESLVDPPYHENLARKERDCTEMATDTLILQNAHDIMSITEEQVFVPLSAIKQIHMRKLQGGANLSTKVSKKYQANVKKINEIVHKIKKLYAELKAQLKKPFRTQGEETRAQQLVNSLSTKLTSAVQFFIRNLSKIQRMPAAVAKAMGQWWPLAQKPTPTPTPQVEYNVYRNTRSRARQQAQPLRRSTRHRA